ncbi:MAG: NADH:flavin oxidoreductase, partial [Candidatus Methanomethylicota archaeon]
MTTLLDPLEVRGVIFKNRIVMPPMATELATENGEVTDQLIKHYVERCDKVGLIIVEHSYASIEGKYSPRQLGIYDDKLIDGLSRLAREIKKRGVIAAIQINHAGGKSSSKITGVKPIAPSSVIVPGGVEEPSEMTLGDIERVQEAFEKAAKRAVKAGFDAIEIHGAHGFLLNQFLSPITNKRLDAYGGTLEKRMKFPLEVVERVREAIGDKLLLYRLGADDMMPEGLTIEESKKFAVKLEKLGVDIIDVSGGLCGSRPEN